MNSLLKHLNNSNSNNNNNRFEQVNIDNSSYDYGIRNNNNLSNNLPSYDESYYFDIPETQTLHLKYRIILACIWSLLIVTGVIGNAFVIFTINKCKKLNNITQSYLFNLAITDILFVIFCIPITTITYINDNWIFGSVLCKLSHFLSFSTVCATCLTLMAMTIDRYLCICYPNFKWRSVRIAFYTKCLIWIASIALSSPYLVYCNTNIIETPYFSNETQPVEYECRITSDKNIVWNHISGWYTTVICYLIPSLIIIYCYMRIILYMSSNTVTISDHLQKSSSLKKKKVTKTVILLTSVFIISWFPVHALAIWYRLDIDSFPQHWIMYIIKLIAHTLSYANPTLNPIIYAFSNEMLNFKTLKSCFKCKNRDHIDESRTAKRNSESLRSRYMCETERLCIVNAIN